MTIRNFIGHFSPPAQVQAPATPDSRGALRRVVRSSGPNPFLEPDRSLELAIGPLDASRPVSGAELDALDRELQSLGLEKGHENTFALLRRRLPRALKDGT